jgi:hypothetical protein
MRSMTWVALVALTAAACGGNDETTAGAGGQGGGSGGSGGDGGAPPVCPEGSHEVEGGACETTFTGWTPGAPLAGSRDHHVTFTVDTETGAYLYAAGGVRNQNTLLDDVEVSAIAEDGSLGPWAAGTSLLGVAAGAGVAVVGNVVIVAGGYRMSGNNPTLSNATEIGVVSDDGSIAWSEGPTMALTRFHHALVSDGAHVYAIGGLTGNNTDNTPMVEVAEVTGSGIGPWSEVTALPEKRSHHGAAIHEGAIYVSGGLSGNPSGTYTDFDEVLRAEIHEDGSLGDWTPAGTLATTLTTHSSFVHAGRLFVVGGIENDLANTGNIRSAPIGEDGTIGAWEMLEPLPSARAHAHQTPFRRGFLYAVAGALNHNSIPDVFIGHFE